MRITTKRYFAVFTNPVSPEAKREIEELDAKEAEADKVQEGTELSSDIIIMHPILSPK